ncbi:MAG TPA: glycosyltransferase family 39 protein [Verrucomicrobiae bacterium]|nr:glycosyltransferase family 39 protein [Verrucomicrobiae bacterium]
MPLQQWIHHWEEGAGARVLKVVAAILGFIAVAGLYNLFAYQSFSSEEAMETAQLAHNISQGDGFTTHSIRPLAVYLLKGKTEAVPDITNPPVYPFLLAGLMKVLPMHFKATQNWMYEPERWIALFNQALFFVAVVLLFRLARRLFDSRVAWLSAILFGATNLYWRFSVSGLSTLWVMVVFLAVVMCLVRIAERMEKAPIGWSALAGVLVGLGGLSRYSFAWMIVPVILFLAMGGRKPRGSCCAAAIICFVIVMGPWVARNIVLTGTPFGTAGYAVVQGTPPLEQETLERSADPRAALRRVEPFDVMDKFLANGRDIWRNDLPRLGGNWVAGFFLVGLLMPFQSPARGRIRLFLVESIILLFVVQALGRTHLTEDLPEINSENLLALLAPLTFVYGVALFYTFIDQINTISGDARSALVGVFLTLMAVPLIMLLLIGTTPEYYSSYSPMHIQRVAGLMRPEELVMSDIPGGVAWYGNRDCSWLSLDDDREFFKINGLRDVKALYLTQRTSNKAFLSQMVTDPKSWGHFFFECEAHLACEGHGEVPSGFPLTKAPSGFLPDQLLLSDRARWRLPEKK